MVPVTCSAKKGKVHREGKIRAGEGENGKGSMGQDC
jgi:hypothetical protein